MSPNEWAWLILGLVGTAYTWTHCTDLDRADKE